MPHIDKVSIKEKYRAWDSDILSKLKINNVTISQNKKNSRQLLGKSQQKLHKSDSKEVANRKQSGSITSSKAEASWEQSGGKPKANWEQTSPKSDSITSSKVVANWERLEEKGKFFSLSGLQRHITIFIYELCRFARDKKTDPISIHQLSDKCRHTTKTVKNAINRLVKKGILFRNYFKNGRGGWTVYSIPSDIHQEILGMESVSKEIANWEQTGSKLAAKLTSKLVADASSSSGIDYINTTTTGDLENSKLDNLGADWLKIDIEPLSKIGFTKTHLMQIASQNKISTPIVQDSIYAFAFDLQENDKAKSIKGDPINFFMGIVRNGKPYTPPGNYESPQDKAMRVYRERMREIEQGRVAAEKEAIDLAYNNWFAQITDAQKKEFLPISMRQGARLEKNKMLESAARGHFEAEIWPDKKNEIVGEIKKAEEQEVSEGQ
jgi:hypothetical protein